MAEVFLTGATGFLGRHVLDQLRARGYRVRALVRGSSLARLPQSEGVLPVPGDLLRPGELTEAMRGCRYLVHVAALYSFAPRDRPLLWRVNVQGTAGILEAARIAGVEKAVVTSSSAAVGPARDGRPATENDGPPLHAFGYHASKVEQERAALAAQLPVVLVLPTAPVGPGDTRPTPTGRLVWDFMQGRIFATVAGGLNLVAVEDAARAHLLALEHGRPGERYLVGGENLTFDHLWELLAEATGRPPPRLRLPHRLVLAAARADELRCRLTGGEPRVPLEGARMASEHMYASSEKAMRELGYRPTPVADALARAVAWYRAQPPRNAT